MKNDRTHPLFHLGHHLEQLVAGVVEVDELALAAEHGRGRAEVAAQGQPTEGITVAAISPGFVRKRDAHVPSAVAGDDQRMPDRLAGVLAQKPPHPADALALTIWSASIRSSRSGTLAMCPPTTIFAAGLIAADQFRTSRPLCLVRA
jgi:hypothetical protein